MADTLDYFVPGVVTQDTKKRIETGEELTTYLQNPKTSMHCEDMDKFIDGLALWINSSSFKVSLLGLEVLSLFISRVKNSFKPYVTSVLSVVIDRLGDNKDQVRENARIGLLSLMSPASTPQYVAERLTPGFTHKLWKVREEILVCLQCALNEWGAKNFTLSKLVPQIIKLLDDPSGPVRDQAAMTLVEFYRHVGEKIRTDLSKREINSSKLSMIFAKMDDVKSRGLMIISESDEMDGGAQSTLAKKARSVSSGRSQPLIPRPSGPTLSNQERASGALDQDGFMRQFEDVPRVHISSSRDVSERMSKIRDTLSDINKDWEKRQEAVRELRSLVVAGANSYPEFQQGLRSCEPCLRTSVLDLRSQVVREACMTLAYLSQELGRDFEHVAEVLIPAIIQLLPNSAKIMSSCGFVALRFIIQNTPSHRLIPLVTCNLTSKSNIIRRQCCELMEQMLRVWPTGVLEKQLSNLQDSIKKGLVDADPETKVHSRRAFWNFDEHFKPQASSIFSSLDPSQQKLLTVAQGGSGSSSSSSTSSINIYSNSAATTRTLPSKSKIRSVSGDRVKSVTGSSKVPQAKSQLPQRIQTVTSENSGNRKEEDMPRSNSTTNLSSSSSSSKIARPTNNNNNNSNNNNNNFHSLRHSQSSSDLSTPAKTQPPTKSLRRNASMRLPRSTAVKAGAVEARCKKLPNVACSTTTSTADVSLCRQSKYGSSTSQPSSRSASPSSRFSYISQPQQNSTIFPNDTLNYLQSIGAPRYGRVPHREPSPLRVEPSEQKRRKSAAPMRVPVRESSTGPVARSDVENALRNTLRRSGSSVKPWRSQNSSMENVGDDGGSETSSLCSDNSAKSFNSEDMSPVISGLLSGSWTDRRDNLLHLQNFFRGHKFLSRVELKRVTDSFERLFYDQNSKVFAVFLDTLVHFISAHKTDLGSWVNVCLPLLLGKLGSESSPCIQNKIQKVLDNIRVFFPGELQFIVLTKYIVDQMQSASVGVKLAVLGYLHELTLTMTCDDIVNTSDIRLALTRIITWSTEPKSPEVRKASTIVFIRLFQLNPERFKYMMGVLPKSFQESGNRILQENSYSLDRDDEVDAFMSNGVTPSSSPSLGMFDASQHRSPISKLPVKLNTSDSENVNPFLNNNNNKIATTTTTTPRRSVGSSSPMVQLGNKPSSRSSYEMSKYSPKISDSIKRGVYRNYDVLDNDDTLRNGSHDCTISKSLLVVDKDIFSEEMTSDDHDEDDIGCPKPDEIDKIIQELAFKNERGEERKLTLVHLILIARNKESVDVWQHHSKTILMLLLETINDELEYIRELALKVIVELVYNHMDRFVSHAELILSSVIEARKDPSSEVAATAQDSALVIASLVPVNLSMSILHPFIVGAEFPTRLLAFRVQMSVLEAVTDKQLMKELLPAVIPGVLKGYEDNMSAIRKESVFTLVRIFLLIGEELKPYLQDLSTSKLKLLNLYIKRALVHRDNTRKTQDTVMM